MYGTRFTQSNTVYLVVLAVAIFFLSPNSFTVKVQKQDLLIATGTLATVSILKNMRF